MSIASRLKALREENGLSQNDLAKETGLSKKSIINYENGYRQPNSKAMAILEQFLMCQEPICEGKATNGMIAVGIMISTILHRTTKTILMYVCCRMW